MNKVMHWQKKNASVEHLTDKETMLLTWNGFQSHAALTEAMNTAYDLIMAKGLKFWISDHRNLEVLSPENQKWINEHFIPKLLSSTTIKKVAIIIGDKMFTNASMEAVKKRATESTLPVESFGNIDQAFAWFEKDTVAAG
jgi:hypothetical protein